ncbi:MAG: hypothetical protein AAF560_08040 [Acidobacteriota bacterium]
MELTADDRRAHLLGPRDIWSMLHELGRDLKPNEARKLHRRLGQMWGQRTIVALTDLFDREFGQSLSEARVTSVVEALGDVCERSDLGRVALDFEDATEGLVHIWQYSCPLAKRGHIGRFAASFFESFHTTVIGQLAGHGLCVRWLATDPRHRVLRFLMGAQSRLAQWDWILPGSGGLSGRPRAAGGIA